MKVGELIEMLEGLDENAEVRIAQQPAWPMEYRLAAVEPVGGIAVPEGMEDEDEVPDDMVVYLVEGGQIGYLPGYVANHLGWGHG